MVSIKQQNHIFIYNKTKLKTYEYVRFINENASALRT